MNKIWRVAQTEFSNSVRSKGFIIGLLAMPIMLLVMGGIQMFALEHTDTTERKFAVVDHTGVVFKWLVEANKDRTDYFGKNDDFTPYTPLNLTGKLDHLTEAELPLELSNQVRDEEIFAFVVIGKDALNPDIEESQFRYFSASPLYTDLPEWLERVVQSKVQSSRIQKAGMDSKTVERLTARVPMQRLGLATRDATGNVKEAEEDTEIKNTVVPMVGMFLLYMLLMTCTPSLLTSVMEEKMNKISEFLVSAITPFQLLMGKLIGVLMVSLLLSTLYLLSISVIASQFGLTDEVTPLKIACFYLFLILGGLMLGSVCVAIGAACNEIRDSQSLMFPVMMIAVFPMMIWVPVMQSPDGIMARSFSLIPPFTPMLMMLRLSIPPGVPLWELILGIVLTTAFSILCVMAAGKIFRIGILSQGQAPSIAKMVKWLMVK